MKTKKIAKPEEWFKEFTPENVQVVMLCASTGNITDGSSGGSDGTITRPTTTSVDSNKSAGIYENGFSYNPFE